MVIHIDMKKILFLLVLFTTAWVCAGALELSDFVLRYRPYGIAATQNCANGDYYYQALRFLKLPIKMKRMKVWCLIARTFVVAPSRIGMAMR